MKKCRRTCKQRGGLGYTFAQYMKNRLGDNWEGMVEKHAKEQYKIYCQPQWGDSMPIECRKSNDTKAEKALNEGLKPELEREDMLATAEDAIKFATQLEQKKTELRDDGAN